MTKYPIKLTEAVHAGKAALTVGGSPTFVMPGGGIWGADAVALDAAGAA